MSTTAVVALISGLAGVGGALVGASATLLVSWRVETAQRKRDHDDAILAFWTAVATWGSLWSSLADILPADSNAIERTLQGLRMGSYGHQLVERQFSAGDALWRAMGRVRMVATAKELRVANAVEEAVGEWKVGHPMPESFGKALRDLRLLVESLGPEGAALAAEEASEQRRKS